MNRRAFLKLLGILPLTYKTMNLQDLYKISRSLSSTKRLPVIFTSHGNPMDIILSREQRPFWKTLYELGKQLRQTYDIQAVLVISAHWCTKGTYVNIQQHQKQIYDYYGFPDEYYKVQYTTNGHPEVARQVQQSAPDKIIATHDWGLDHGAWPMLMHLFPEGDIPAFELSIHYYAKPEYHYHLAQQLKSLREKGVLIIGSGALIHNLRLAMQKMQNHDSQPYGWENEYDAWIKEQINKRNIQALLNYETSHPLGKLAAPTPDHFVPMLYTFGTMDSKDEIHFFYEAPSTLPAFSERSFIAV